MGITQSLFNGGEYKKEKGPNSAHGEQIEALMLFMGDKLTDRQKYRYWCGRTKTLSVEQIYAMIKKAKEGTNPPALFNYLLKQHNDRIRAAKNPKV